MIRVCWICDKEIEEGEEDLGMTTVGKTTICHKCKQNSERKEIANESPVLVVTEFEL